MQTCVRSPCQDFCDRREQIGEPSYVAFIFGFWCLACTKSNPNPSEVCFDANLSLHFFFFPHHHLFRIDKMPSQP